MTNNQIAEIRKRIHGPCSLRTTQHSVDFDVGLFFQRLLLFETYIMRTVRLLEFPYLIRMIGYEEVLQILESGILKIDCDTSVLAEISHLKASKSIQRKGKMKLGSFSFANMLSAEKKKYVSECLECVSAIHGITVKQKKKLKLAIVDQILPDPENSGKQSITNFRQDVLNNRPIVKSAVIHQIKRQKNVTLDPSQTEITFSKGSEAEDEFDSESNLSSLLQIDKDEVHKILQRALFGVGELNRRIENMQNYNALSGFINDEIPLFEEKLSFLEALVSPDTSVKEFQRVMSITGLPDFDYLRDGSTRINIDKFLKIRESEECRDFREWITNLGSTTDDEIIARTRSLRTKLSSAIHSPVGKVLKFLVTTAAGFVGAGGAVGIGASVLDNFLLDKILPKTGITTFINRLYPSIFEEPTNHNKGIN